MVRDQQYSITNWPHFLWALYDWCLYSFSYICWAHLAIALHTEKLIALWHLQTLQQQSFKFIACHVLWDGSNEVFSQAVQYIFYHGDIQPPKAFKFCYNLSWQQPTERQFKKLKFCESPMLLWKTGLLADTLIIRCACQILLEQKTHAYWRIKEFRHSTSWRQVVVSLVMIHKKHKLSPTLDWC